jgi:DNA-binding transcriptional regulator YdaS (Cro superfamily)
MLLSQWLSEERGRGADLARELKVPPSMVARMASWEKPVPLAQCPFIQKFTDNKVTCEELRPDKADYFALIRQLPVPAVPQVAFNAMPQAVRRAVVGAN